MSKKLRTSESSTPCEGCKLFRGDVDQPSCVASIPEMQRWQFSKEGYYLEGETTRACKDFIERRSK